MNNLRNCIFVFFTIFPLQHWRLQRWVNTRRASGSCSSAVWLATTTTTKHLVLTSFSYIWFKDGTITILHVTALWKFYADNGKINDAPLSHWSQNSFEFFVNSDSSELLPICLTWCFHQRRAHLRTPVLPFDSVLLLCFCCF